MQEAGYGQFNKLTTIPSAAIPTVRLAAVFQAMARQIHVDAWIAMSDYPMKLSTTRQGRHQLCPYDMAALQRRSNFWTYCGRTAPATMPLTAAPLRCRHDRAERAPIWPAARNGCRRPSASLS
jgi:hypothetical protein